MSVKRTDYARPDRASSVRQFDPPLQNENGDTWWLIAGPCIATLSILRERYVPFGTAWALQAKLL